MIRFEHVNKGYPARGEALRDLSFELAAGEMAFLTGHSGAGKSTLLKLIGLLERPSRGQIIVEGRSLADLPRRRIPYHRRRIGMIFQDHQLLSDRSVHDNVALPLAVTGMPSREIGRRVRAALDQVGLLAFERAQPVSLSGGEQQRVVLARALIGNPKVLLADEPTGNLDHRTGEMIIGLLGELHRAHGLISIYVTHNLTFAQRCDRILELREGKLSPLAADAWPDSPAEDKDGSNYV